MERLVDDEENIFEKIKRQTPKMTFVYVMRRPNGLLNGGTEIMGKNQSKIVISLWNSFGRWGETRLK